MSDAAITAVVVGAMFAIPYLSLLGIFTVLAWVTKRDRDE